MSGLASPEMRQRQLAALAPLLAFAGGYIEPVASVLLPFLLFLIIRNRNMPLASTMAVRTADLAFSIVLLLLLNGLLIEMLGNIEATAHLHNENFKRLVHYALLYYFIVSLIIAFVQAVRGKVFKYPISFRMSEKILFRQAPKDAENN